MAGKLKKEFWDKEQLIQKWFHSRKVAIYLGVMVVGTIALFIHKLDGGQWVDVTKWATSGYMGSNAVDGIADALRSKNNS